MDVHERLVLISAYIYCTPICLYYTTYGLAIQLVITHVHAFSIVVNVISGYSSNDMAHIMYACYYTSIVITTTP